MRLNFIKRTNASDLILTMMVWAIFSLLTVRLYLNLTGFPQFHFYSWHIAHVLWGGLAMLLGMIITLVAYGNRAQRLAAAVFGFGFGWFADELGKYLSRDNNYFFQPAIMIIYGLFVFLFLLYRYFEKSHPKDPKTLLYQSTEAIGQAIENDLQLGEKTQAILRLKSLKSHLPLSAVLYSAIRRLPTAANNPVSLPVLLWRSLKSAAFRLFRQRWILNTLILISLIYIFSAVSDAVYVVSHQSFNLNTKSDVVLFKLKTLVDLLIALFFFLGIYHVSRRKPKKGIRYYQFGLIIHIFISSFFRFYFEQFSGIFGLASSTVIFYGLDRLKREIRR